MKMAGWKSTLVAALALAGGLSAASAQGQAQPAAPAPARPMPAATTIPRAPGDPLQFLNQPASASWVLTDHQITVNGKVLNYIATAGFMPIREESETEAMMFFVSYTLKDAPAPRPLLFSFNGGPGSSSVWLHMGALGPRRVKLQPDGQLPQPPFALEDNPGTWLDKADLCFIDPVGTGYSRPAKPELGQKFWSVQGDLDSVAEFIRMYVTLRQRHTSPLFVVGESYGTFRAAGLANALASRGTALNGIVLISTVLNFQTLRMTQGNDLPYVTYLPTYTATAFFHKKLPSDLQRDLGRTLAEVEKWASTDYVQALFRGAELPEAEREAIAERLARYTGLSKDWILRSDLRINDEHFRKELLRGEGWTVGRFDSRFKGVDRSGVTHGTDYDPSYSAVDTPYTTALGDYLRAELKFESEQRYHILGSGLRSPWRYESAGNAFADTSSALRSAMARNPYLKVLVCNGYYDMATPYFGARYTFNHMGLDRRRDNVKWTFYPAGHMMYIDVASLTQLKNDAAAFIDSALPR